MYFQQVGQCFLLFNTLPYRFKCPATCHEVKHPLISPNTFREGYNIWIHFGSSQENYPSRWEKGKFVEFMNHAGKVKRLDRGSPIAVAYEHFRLVTMCQTFVTVAKNLQECFLRDLLFRESGNNVALHSEEVGKVRSPLTSTCNGEPERDLFACYERGEVSPGTLVTNDEQVEPEKLYSLIGNEHISSRNP